MFFETYPAHYRDRFGEVTTTIDNDGKELRLMLRDVAFTISDLEALEPDPRTDAAQLARFALSPKWGCVWDYTLEFDLPLPVLLRKEPLQGVLHIQLTIEADPLKGDTWAGIAPPQARCGWLLIHFPWERKSSLWLV